VVLELSLLRLLPLLTNMCFGKRCLFSAVWELLLLLLRLLLTNMCLGSVVCLLWF
jgi:hypothetical protein